MLKKSHPIMEASSKSRFSGATSDPGVIPFDAETYKLKKTGYLLLSLIGNLETLPTQTIPPPHTQWGILLFVDYTSIKMQKKKERKEKSCTSAF